MRGSIVRRKDRFYVVTDVPPGPDGKRRQKWHAGYPTRREAEQQLRRVLCELDASRWVEPSDRTLGAYLLEDWLPAMATTVRPATLRIYRQSITAYVLPALGQRRLADLDPLLLTTHYAKLLATPLQRRIGTLSPLRVRYVHVGVEARTRRRGAVAPAGAQPGRGSPAPSASASRPPEMKTWTVEQLRRFLAGTADSREHAGYVLAAACGLRRGEVCGLRWTDVDLDPAASPTVLRVRQLVVIDGQPVVTVQKTRASLRWWPSTGGPSPSCGGTSSGSALSGSLPARRTSTAAWSSGASPSGAHAFAVVVGRHPRPAGRRRPRRQGPGQRRSACPHPRAGAVPARRGGGRARR